MIAEYIQYALSQFHKQLLFGRDPDWREIRAEHLLAYPTCAACGGKRLLEVHHLIPVSFCPDLEQDKSNLLTLCEYNRCHLIVGHGGNWADFNPFAVEDSALMLSRRRSRIRSGLVWPFDDVVSAELRDLQLYALERQL